MVLISMGWTVSRACSTPYGIRGLAPNYFDLVFKESAECSTPYGIRGLAPFGPSYFVIIL